MLLQVGPDGRRQIGDCCIEHAYHCREAEQQNDSNGNPVRSGKEVSDKGDDDHTAERKQPW